MQLPCPTAQPARWPELDVLKALAAQLIVLHHLAYYGPLSDAMAAHAPRLSDALIEYGRMAVQVFLALGGFLATQALQRGPVRWADGPRLLGLRYLRLIGPFAAALVLAIVANALCRPWLDSASVSGPVSLGQWLAHLGFVHTWLGVESLSAGVWYVAMDWQLHALLVALLCGFASPRRRMAAVAGVTLASLLYVNLNPDWDHHPLYFFGAYGLGAALALAARAQQLGRALSLITAAVTLAMAVAWRERLLVTLGTVWLIAWTLRARALANAAPGASSNRSAASSRSDRLRDRLMALAAASGNSSYALFLVHFPVCLLVNAAVQRGGWDIAGSGQLTLALIVLTCLLCHGAAWAFHHGVERPWSRVPWATLVDAWATQVKALSLREPWRRGAQPD